jgi:GTPase
LVDLCGH